MTSNEINARVGKVNWVYLIKPIGGTRDGLYKLGVSYRPQTRIIEIKTETQATSINIFAMVTPIEADGFYTERYLKHILSKYNVDSEYFLPDNSVLDTVFNFVKLIGHTGFFQLQGWGRSYYHNGELIKIGIEDYENFF